MELEVHSRCELGDCYFAKWDFHVAGKHVPRPPAGGGCPTIEVGEDGDFRAVASLLPHSAYWPGRPEVSDVFVWPDELESRLSKLRISEPGADYTRFSTIAFDWIEHRPEEHVASLASREGVDVVTVDVHSMAETWNAHRSTVERGEVRTLSDGDVVEWAIPRARGVARVRTYLEIEIGRKATSGIPTCGFATCTDGVGPLVQDQKLWELPSEAGGALVDARSSDGSWQTVAWLRPRDAVERLLVPIEAACEAVRLRCFGSHDLGAVTLAGRVERESSADRITVSSVVMDATGVPVHVEDHPVDLLPGETLDIALETLPGPTEPSCYEPKVSIGDRDRTASTAGRSTSPLARSSCWG